MLPLTAYKNGKISFSISLIGIFLEKSLSSEKEGEICPCKVTTR